MWKQRQIREPSLVVFRGLSAEDYSSRPRFCGYFLEWSSWNISRHVSCSIAFVWGVREESEDGREYV